MNNPNEIKALVNLLDDPDDFIFEDVRSKLLVLGTEVIPYLEDFWKNNNLDEIAFNKVDFLIKEINFNVIFKELKSWEDAANQDLFEGVLIINKYQNPSVDKDLIINLLNKIKQDIWLEISNNLTSFEKINIINKILFEEYGFSGNKENYHSPHNSFLSSVLETKKGNPLSLSIVYLLVTQELGLPINGVNLPNHFVVCYLDEEKTNFHLPNEEEDVLVYINPFSNGKMFNHEEIDRFLFQLNAQSKKEYYIPCSNKAIIKRMIHNLIYSYQKLNNSDKIEELKKMLSIFN